MQRVITFVAGTLLAVPAYGQRGGPLAVALAPPNKSLAAEFTQVTDVRELPDGRVLVVDLLERTVHVAAFGTGSVSRIGRNGSGPREYEQPTALLAISRDSTILLDPRNGRWLLMAGAEIVGTVGPDAPVLTAGTRAPNGADMLGNVIALKPIVSGPATATSIPRRDSLLLVRMSRATGVQDSLAMLLARPTVLRVEGPASAPTSVSITMNPLTTGETATVFPDGWIAIVRLDPYRVEWIGARGERVAGPPLPFERVRVDEREQGAFLQRESVRTGRPPRDPASLPPWPEFVGPFTGALLTASDGNLWIRRRESTANLTPPYDVINRRGELIARVAVGKDVNVIGFGNDVVYTVRINEDGIQTLQRRPMPRLN